MKSLDSLLTNPAGLLAVVCLVAVVVIANLALLALLRGGGLSGLVSRVRRDLDAEAVIWRQSVAGGQAARQQQANDLDQLHQLVAKLQEPPDKPPPD